jgi:hypothetical protein
MMRFIGPRLRVPAVTALAGTAFAVAWLVRGGPTWWVAIAAELTVLARVVALYALGGADTDEGALAGSRADERQKLVGLRSSALAGKAALAASFVGLTIAIAIKGAPWWPFLVMLIITGFGYICGLSAYGSGEPEPTDAPGAADGVRSPVGS